MATFDQLSAEQRAVIELVLGSGRSYDALADMLGATPSRVRELAREALTELSPATASRVDPEWRGQLVDYMLGQQSGPESTATQSHLKRSEPARVWSYSVLDSLDHLYGNGARPVIPGADGGGVAPRRERERKRERERDRKPAKAEAAEAAEKPKREPLRKPAGEPLSDEARAVVRRRRFVGGGIGLLVLAGVIVGIIALASGGGSDNNKKKSTAASAASQKVTVLGELILNGQNGNTSKGVAVIAKRATQTQLIVQASLPASKQGEAYVVWMFNSPKDAVSVGAQVANSKGQFQGAGPLPANYTRFKFIDVTRQKISSNTTYSGTSVLRGALASMVTPQQAAQAQQQQQQQGGGTGTGTTPAP
jgi:hypothetical protein